MKIVIDIPEDEYNDITLTGENTINLGVLLALRRAVRNGTPLPKGHGRLIDYSWVVDNVIKKLGIKDERYLLEAEKALMSIIEIAPTIIEGSDEE